MEKEFNKSFYFKKRRPGFLLLLLNSFSCIVFSMASFKTNNTMVAILFLALAAFHIFAIITTCILLYKRKKSVYLQIAGSKMSISRGIFNNPQILEMKNIEEITYTDNENIIHIKARGMKRIDLFMQLLAKEDADEIRKIIREVFSHSK